jgi:type I restriction enzyme, R subunit
VPPTEDDTCRRYVLPNLHGAGWPDERILGQRYFTDGRIVPAGRKHVRKVGKKADYLLLYRPDYPIAVVEAKAAYKKPGDGLQQAMEYAEILDLKFAYSTNGKGIIEHDYTTGQQAELATFPTPEELWKRLQGHLKLQSGQDATDYLTPLNRELRGADGTVKEPRYYQQIAINRTVQAVLQGRKRLLLTMATGTGKTFTAAQIVWKLWKTKRKKRILFLADRDVLVDHPQTRDFSIFGEAVTRIQGKANKSREIYFSLYQALAEDEARPGLYKDYPRDFFDLIIIDECHRGSARDTSSWRRILDYFEPATQVGMTATPKRMDNVDTYQYFGNPIFTYSLAQGIDDGFLAPFRVHRVVPSVDATGWRPDKGQLDRLKREIPDSLYTTPDFERTLSLLTRTQAIAKHLSEFMKKNGRFDKTIVFCVDQEHAEQMRQALHAANEDLAREHPHYVARIVSDEGDVGKRHLEDFIDPDKRTPVIVTTSQLLSTGVDVLTCKNVVLFRPIGSMVEFKQIVGRGTRVFEEKDKLWFNIIDYSGATKHFADPEFDGEPEKLTEEQIDENGDPIAKPVQPNQVAEPREEYEAGEQPVIIDEPEGEARKFYVDGVHVAIAAEVVYELDANGRRLRAVKYTDYSAEQVRALYPSASQLRERWTASEERAAVEHALRERGITFEALAEVTRQPDADPLDLLLHVAWQTPLRTRRERAERVKQEGRSFFERFTEPARRVLNDLLDKYTDHGVTQLDDLHVLEIPPISERGSVVEIAQAFGGREGLLKAISELQRLIYVA